MARYVAEQFFRTCRNAIRLVDHNHLLLGARFVSWTTPKEVNRAIAEFADVVSVDHYKLMPFPQMMIQTFGGSLDWIGPEDMLLHFQEDTGKPVLITEFSFRASDSKLQNTWPPRWLFLFLRPNPSGAGAIRTLLRERT